MKIFEYDDFVMIESEPHYIWRIAPETKLANGWYKFQDRFKTGRMQYHHFVNGINHNENGPASLYLMYDRVVFDYRFYGKKCGDNISIHEWKEMLSELKMLKVLDR